MKGGSARKKRGEERYVERKREKYEIIKKEREIEYKIKTINSCEKERKKGKEKSKIVREKKRESFGKDTIQFFY